MKVDMPKSQSTETKKDQQLLNREQAALLESTMKRFNYRRDALLEVLTTAQERFGYLPREALLHISQKLDIPLSQVYGVATFYHLYVLDAAAERHCFICNDVACSIKGSEAVLQAAETEAEKSPAQKIRIHRTNCLGLCDQAPAALLDGEAYTHLNAETVGTLFQKTAPKPVLRVNGEPRILTRRIGKLSPTDLAACRNDGAFSALEKAIWTMTPEQVIAEVKASGLTGRGGAGFPTGLKWEFTRTAPGDPKYVVCNFDESEPGTFKDRLLMEGDPFRTIEGILLCAYAIGAPQGYIFIRGEYVQAARIVQQAIDALYAANILGKAILGSDFNFDLEIRRGAGAYICGEETALFEAIEGKRGNPRSKPPFPTTEGLFGQPTSINNVETLAIVPDLILNGGTWLRQWGTEKSVGLKLFCLSGHVRQPGVVEAPYGLTVRQIIEKYGGGFDGLPQAILMGGASGGLLHPDDLDTPLTHEDLNPLGTPIGSGVIMVFNQDVNLLDVLKSVARFFETETCGQCISCRVGTRQISNLLEKISLGQGEPEDLTRLENLCTTMQSVGECGLGQTAPNPILSSLRNFRPRLEAYVEAWRK
jgi:NADH-quinone oxidoreductase subunit F